MKRSPPPPLSFRIDITSEFSMPPLRLALASWVDFWGGSGRRGRLPRIPSEWMLGISVGQLWGWLSLLQVRRVVVGLRRAVKGEEFQGGDWSWPNVLSILALAAELNLIRIQRWCGPPQPADVASRARAAPGGARGGIPTFPKLIRRPYGGELGPWGGRGGMGISKGVHLGGQLW